MGEKMPPQKKKPIFLEHGVLGNSRSLLIGFNLKTRNRQGNVVFFATPDFRRSAASFLQKQEVFPGKKVNDVNKGVPYLLGQRSQPLKPDVSVSFLTQEAWEIKALLACSQMLGSLKRCQYLLPASSLDADILSYGLSRSDKVYERPRKLLQLLFRIKYILIIRALMDKI